MSKVKTMPAAAERYWVVMPAGHVCLKGLAAAKSEAQRHSRMRRYSFEAWVKGEEDNSPVVARYRRGEEVSS